MLAVFTAPMVERPVLRICSRVSAMTDSLDQVSACLADLANGDGTALDRLLPHIYDELRAMARRMYRGDPTARTLNPTALVHEAYARLARQDPKAYEGRKHFMKVAAVAMRQLLTDYARERKAQKRGGGGLPETLCSGVADQEAPPMVDLIDLESALREFEVEHPRQAKVVELRFLVGLSVAEAAEVLGVSERTAHVDWEIARRWLTRALDEPEP